MVSPRPSQRAPFGPTLGLAVTLAVAAFAVVMPLVMSTLRPVVLPAPFPPQHQRGETLSYLLAFGVILPLAVAAARWLCDVVAAGPNAPALSALTGVLAAALAAALVAVRLAGRLEQEDGVKVVLAAAVVWWLGAGLLLARASRTRPWPPLLALGRRGLAAWGLAAVAGLLALLCFAYLHSISLPGLGVCALAAAAAIAVHGGVRIRRLPRGWGVAADLAALGALLLLVPDLVIFRPEEAARSLSVALETGIIQFHHNFLLGPANEVLDGRAMLVGTASQYGVSSIYLLAAWFQIAPIGYGTLGLLTGALTALWFGAGYGVLRLAGTSRLVSVAASGVAVDPLVFNLSYPIGSLPQSGPFVSGCRCCSCSRSSRLSGSPGAPAPRTSRRPRPSGWPACGRWRPSRTQRSCSRSWPASERGSPRRRGGCGGWCAGGWAPCLRAWWPTRCSRGSPSSPPAGCRTGASTSRTCGSSSPATPATSPTTSRAGRRGSPSAPVTWPRRPRWPSWSAGAGRSSSASARP